MRLPRDGTRKWLQRLEKTQRSLGRGFTLVELMVVVAIISVLAAIAIPKFMAFQAQARQSEAKANLKGIFAAVRAHVAEANQFTCGFCGFAPEQGYRYNYYPDETSSLLSPGNSCDKQKGGLGATKQTDPDPASDTPGAFTAGATANIDEDDTCDGWTINDFNNLANVKKDIDY